MKIPRILVGAIAALASFSPGFAQGFQQLTAPYGVSGVLPSNTPLGSGVVSADFDGDGDIDIIAAPPYGGMFVMLRNDGGMAFTDVSATSGLGWHGFARCLEVADVDNDGDTDLFVGSALEPAKLFLNNGNGTFVESAAARGLTSADDTYAATFGDYDRDGWIDLYLGNRSTPNGSIAPNRLYRNLGNGYFTDTTATAGVAGSGLALVATFLDFDEDLWPDLLVANDKGAQYGANELFRNNGDGTFANVGAQYNANIAVDGMGLDHLDVFNDGGVDFFCTDLAPTHLFEVWDPVANAYSIQTATYGLQGGYLGWACNFFDYDNDGWQDLHVVHISQPNMLFHNPGQPAAAQVPWTNVAPALGLDQSYSQFTVSVADFDDDGRVDLLQRYALGFPASSEGLTLHQNQVATGNWLKLRTIGRRSNRDGLGARVAVTVGTMTQRQWVRSGVGYLGGSDRRLHFGLGNATLVDHVEITWPSGQVQHLTDIAANQIIDVVEPVLTTPGQVAVGGATTIDLSVPGDELLPYMIVLSLSANTGIALPDGDVIPIDFDFVTALTLDPLNPVLVGSVGTLDQTGAATATLNVPPLPFLSGWTLYGAALTTDQPTFPYARTVLAHPITIAIQ